MKAEDLSLIKRYSIVEYLERKGINPVRRTSSYVMYRSPLRAETHPSFKVDIQKNLWIDYTEGRAEALSTSVCAWRAARYWKPSVIWDGTLPMILHIVFATTSHQTISNLQWLQMGQGN